MEMTAEKKYDGNVVFPIAHSTTSASVLLSRSLSNLSINLSISFSLFTVPVALSLLSSVPHQFAYSIEYTQ